jgi:hypothetical protein
MAALAGGLAEKCPFIDFAFIGGMDSDGSPVPGGAVEIFVFTAPETRTLDALELTLPLLDHLLPGIPVDLIVMNNVDPGTRHRAMQETCLFVRPGRETIFDEFRNRSDLDYRLLRAQMRRKGGDVSD